MKTNGKKGIAVGLGSGFFWGLDTVLLGMVLMLPPFSLEGSASFMLAPFISTFAHDFFSSLWVGGYLALIGKAKKIGKAFMSSSGRWVAFGALCGGPIGMSCYLLSIQYIGSSYTAAISAMYPAVGAFFGFVFLKDRLKMRGIAGLGLAIFATVLLGFTTPDKPVNLIIGILFALGCALGWGLECVIVAYGMKDDLEPDVSLFIRQFTSALTYAIVILPLVGGYQAMPELLANPMTLFYIALVALCGSTSYLLYYTAIDGIGPTRAMGLNISYSAWAIFIGYMLGQNEFSLRVLILACMIILGSMLTAGDPEEFKIGE